MKCPDQEIGLSNSAFFSPDTGRGMMAIDDIEAGEVIVSVPRKFLITNDSLAKIYGSNHALSSQQLLALHLVALKKDTQSWWKAYIDLLPLHFNTMPVKYTKVLVDHLPTTLKEEVLQQKENMHNDYLACVSYLKSNPDILDSIQPEEYEWAWLCGK